MNAELEYWKVGLAFIGMVLVALIPAWLGYRTAKRLNLTSATLEEIKDRATFRKILMDQVEKQSKRITDLMKKIADLEETNLKSRLKVIALLAMVDNYEARLKACEERQDAHELICGPKNGDAV